MNYAVISGDVVAFTSLSNPQKEALEARLRALNITLAMQFDTYSRLVKGDYWECVVPQPADALTVALLAKSWVKAFTVNPERNQARLKSFETYGIRLAIGYGTLQRLDPERGIIDGEAIYLSGRKMGEESTHGKERVVIKNTLFFISGNPLLDQALEPLMALIDHTINKATEKQSLILYHKLLGKSENEIADELGISQSSVNQHSTSLGWNAIEKAVTYFRQKMKSP
ncbi:fumarate hydratase [Allomuricauda sp. SCSIO 65647]|uniref:helix-turn-helix transcriptional regulator n=1 Tax=Allomuricauda sp. SCSIO 65647 TaxID=2908843 RepID=UPI001F2B203D|nr:fumarate hydratase [Muricauda sp. SCSIO 65647]UJH67413.1 fumarate hydratase [Muricauda sp. SCSIO 65647]